MKVFFDKVREELFGGTFLQTQVDGINRLVEAFAKYGDGNVNSLAIILATSWWETGKRMQPVKETQFIGQETPTDSQVIMRLDTAFKAGKLKWVKTPYWRTGFFGRGDVQLTHEANYRGPARTAVLKEFGVDIHKEPSAVLKPEISAFILIKGTLEGWFTGKKFSDFVDDLDEDDAEDLREFIASRAVVNGKDRAFEIGSAALKFEKAIRAEEATFKTEVEQKVPPQVPGKVEFPEDDYRPGSEINWGLFLVALIGVAVLAAAAFFFLNRV